MPRTWEPKQGVSPFADYLIERMQAHQPPLRPHHLAEALRVAPAVVSAWLTKGSIPRRETVDDIAYVFGDAREPWYTAAGIPLPSRPSRQVPPALGFPTAEVWEAQIEQAENMPWPQDRKAIVIQSLRELRVEMMNRLRYEVPPSNIDWNLEIYRTYSSAPPEEQARLVDHVRRMQIQYGVSEQEKEEQPAGPGDSVPKARSPRRPRAK